VAEATKKNLNALIAEYQPQLKSFIRQRVGNREDAEDILQDVFYQLIRTVNEAMNPIEHVSAWLYRVARNMIINAGVKKREEELPLYHDEGEEVEMMQDITDVLFGDETTSPSPETEYLRRMVWDELETALSELPAEQREVFELTELDGVPVKVIAENMGLTVNTILSRKHYAVVHLRRRLAGLYEDIISP